MYLINTEKGQKGVTPERLLEAMKGNFNPQLLQIFKK